MKLCVVSFKEVWRGRDNRWVTDGGFPLQMGSIASLFSETTMVLVQVPARPGGTPLPEHVRIVPIDRPVGEDLRRKISVVAHVPSYLRTIAREIRRADVVHTPLPGDISLLGLVVAQALGKRLVARYCGSWDVTSQTTTMNRVTRAWMRRTAGGRNVMLATGDGSAPPAKGMHWIFATALSATEIADVRPDLDRSPSSPPRLVFIGRLEAGKGLDILIDALAQIGRAGAPPPPRVTFIGHGSLRPALERQASDLGVAVEFTGLLRWPELSRRLLDADLCVQPSLSEGFSKAWLDALAHGVPVIAGDVGAARSVIGGGGARGWLVEPGSTGSLVDALDAARASGVDWPALRRRCRTFAERHTLETWGSRIASICAEQWGGRVENGRLVA